MRLVLLAGPLLAVGLAASSAAADIYEPNNVSNPPMGLLVPIDSTPEIQLYTLFQQRGEALDWHHDAHITPNAFSPHCGFTATYVLNQAGSHFGLAWYNETGQPPAAADLHQLLAPNSPVGTMFNGTTIQADPAYLGGLVGFALVGGETHYTNSAYDTVCSFPLTCNPSAPWITALMYASTVTPEAYYICFEDGNTSAFGWNNDGDFNDDVFFVTGISCEGGGQPCDTGKPGICAAGLTQCSPTGTTCQQLNQPKMTETCNGQDDNCNGMIDEGNICPTGEVCDKGSCVKSCAGGEFQCPPSKVCDAGGHCVDPTCAAVNCPMGKVCVSGKCKGPCDGVVCPHPQTCRVGACVDPCAGVMCTQDQVCDNGVCMGSCTCAPCPAGKACDMPSGQCLDPSCVGKTCAAGTYCKAGTCVDDCMGAVCPAGEACKAGQCVMSQGMSTSASTGTGGGSSSTGFNFGGGGGTSGPSGPTGAGGQGAGPATGAGGVGGGSSGRPGKTAGCGCRVAGEDRGGEVALAGVALAVAAAARRRRRR